jgi:hypothetical protein
MDIEPGNQHFRVADTFLMDFSGRIILHYFGDEAIVTIPDQVEIIASRSFSASATVSSVRFGPNSLISIFEAEAFEDCVFLSSFSVPASVEFIGDECFIMDSSLSDLHFASDSKLRAINRAGFSNCYALRSVTLPASIEFLGWGCFLECPDLVSFTFLPGSKLVHLPDSVFCGCSSLGSLTIPRSVERIGFECFQGCRCLSTLVFESQARIRELLDIPPRWTGLQWIPDTVESLQFYPDPQKGCYCVLMFGRESRLVQLRLGRRFDEAPPRIFVQASPRTLKAMRLLLEFVDPSG